MQHRKCFDTFVCTEIDAASVFKKNMKILNFDGSEEHLASQKLLNLVGGDIFRFRELMIFDLPTSIQALNSIIEPPVRVRRGWSVNTNVQHEEGLDLTDEEKGDLEDLQRELQLLKNLAGTVSKIVHEGIILNQDMVFLNTLVLLLRQGKHETSQSRLPFITETDNYEISC